MIWPNTALTGGASSTYSHGIADILQDINLVNISYAPNENTVTKHDNEVDYWIQSGAAENSGITLSISETNIRTLKIDVLDVCSNVAAGETVIRIQKAIESVSTMRSLIGA